MEYAEFIEAKSLHVQPCGIDVETLPAEYAGYPLEYEHRLISCILNDPQQLPEIFKFLSAQDFEDEDCAHIYAAFDGTYSGMAMDTKVWLKKVFESLGGTTEIRIDLRGRADAVIEGAHPVTLARKVRKEYLRRAMDAAVRAYADFNVYRLSK